MRYHIAFKFLAIVLCVCALAGAVGSFVAVTVIEDEGLYHLTLDEYLNDRTAYDCNNAAALVASRYASKTLGNCPKELLDAYFPPSRYNPTTTSEAPWYYTLRLDGRVLESNYKNQPGFETREYGGMICRYISPVDEDVLPPATELDPDIARSADIAGTEGFLAEAPTEGPEDASADDTVLYYDNFNYYSESQNAYINYELAYRNSPEYTVTLYVTAASFIPTHWPLIEFVYANRYLALVALAVSVLAFAACFTYLCFAAGRSPEGGQLRPGGLNRMPLDLYAGLSTALILTMFGIFSGLARTEPTRIFSVSGGAIRVDWGYVTLAVLPVITAALAAVALLFALAAQIKVGGGFWWRHSVIWVVCRTAWRLFTAAWSWLRRAVPGFLKAAWAWLRKAVPGGLSRLGRGIRVLWGWVSRGIGRLLSLLGRGIKRFYALLPLTWQWLLTGAFMLFLALLTVACLDMDDSWLWILCPAAYLGIILYGAHAFGVLLESTKRMSQGELDTKISDRYLVGSFAEFAGDLNALADVAVAAAQKQMRSERMKAELVTNVSHDIKTPLTSIINYVDLLQKAKTQEEAEQYLEVLDRQAQRMKRLIEDLIEMSKATTGNIAVEIARVNAVETVNQALGEFSDKLAAAQLKPVYTPPEGPVMMEADGRLAWRVLSNLLSNAVKYALPGTRLYIDLVELDDRVLISLKNISRDQLNVDASELTERFVRGDASRNTEGSGLGLNIAQSLMELQHGQLRLLVDGDLFKATLLFPRAK